MSDEVTDARPLQVRIADDLRNQIRRGDLAPGNKLPALHALAERYEVSVIVARGSIDLLRQEGLLTSRKGSGTYVREPKRARRYGLQRYSRSVWGGPEPQSVLRAEGAEQGQKVEQETETAQIPAPPFVVERLPDVEEGDLVFVRRRITKLDGTINQSADSYFSLATAEQNPEIVDGPGGHIADIDRVSPVREIQEEIGARMPTGPEASRLRIPPGTPVFEVIRTYHTEDGPLDVAQFLIRADMAVFDYRFPVPD
ncbi:GntR family transcriptional regulator [Nocardiopsis metallicus]|uniref:GntR family transcriptional regulator n=1 Tax=Nocardiopsis metallicus TaxID=179819 RepID=A0A840WMF0_9ACTN|nr:GntR family transcriptional regulator [Nocardiopsis metallicus]MBB5494171.1 GntR family transcriptional regulator [Nocardiopsis metallicus]